MTELDRVLFLLCAVGLAASGVLLGLYLANGATPFEVMTATVLVGLNSIGVVHIGLKGS